MPRMLDQEFRIQEAQGSRLLHQTWVALFMHMPGGTRAPLTETTLWLYPLHVNRSLLMDHQQINLSKPAAVCAQSFSLFLHHQGSLQHLPCEKQSRRINVQFVGDVFLAPISCNIWPGSSQHLCLKNRGGCILSEIIVENVSGSVSRWCKLNSVA